jgi:hypothetical protein
VAATGLANVSEFENYGKTERLTPELLSNQKMNLCSRFVKLRPNVWRPVEMATNISGIRRTHRYLTRNPPCVVGNLLNCNVIAQPQTFSCPRMSNDDELAEIDGIKPNVYLQDGVEQEVKSASRSTPNSLQEMQ